MVYSYCLYMSLNISLKYILLILSSFLFIFISISGILFSLLKFEFIYQYNLSIYPIEERTSLPIDLIENTNIQIKEYFFSQEEFLNVELFNDKEILHMKDVKEIINNLFLFGKISSLILVLIAFLVIYKFKVHLYSIFKYSSIIFIIIIFLFFLLSLISFNKIFMLFHEIAFRNDLWLLNINEDYLLMMFPESFFRDVAIFLLLSSLIVNFIMFYITKSLSNKA
ncbi:MAG: TIGR01906 family membrane protein [Dehalococcoidia bacterium]